MFKKINSSVACIGYWGHLVGYHYNVIFLATPTKKSVWGNYQRIEEVNIQDVSDTELLRLWPHRTREKGYYQRSTENLLRKELTNRGYSFVNDVWKK